MLENKTQEIKNSKVMEEPSAKKEIYYLRNRLSSLPEYDLTVLRSATLRPTDVALITGCSEDDAYDLLSLVPPRKRYSTMRRETFPFLLALNCVMDIPALREYLEPRCLFPLECYNYGIFFKDFNFIAMD